MCSLLKNRSDGRFLCNICWKQIKQNKFPKRSHVNKLKFANFPRSFIRKLKQKCKFQEQNKSDFNLDGPDYERKGLKLNRLEAFLLKCVIPVSVDGNKC